MINIKTMTVVLTVILCSMTMISADKSPEVIVIDVDVTPNCVSLTSNGPMITAHADIPFADVDPSSIELCEVSALYVFEDDCDGNLVAKFDSGQIKENLNTPTAILTLTGKTLDGTKFTGTDTVKTV